MYKLLKNNHNFRYLYFGGMISCIGDYFYDIAVTLLVYDITKSINSIAFMWISKGALRIFVQYLAGIITDKYDRRKIIIFTNIISIPIALIFITSRYLGLWVIYLCSFLLQALNDIDGCSEMAILPEIVIEEDLKDANTIFSITETIVMFISLAISSLVYKFFGANILFVLNSISFLGASLFFSLIKYKKKSSNEVINKLVLFDREVVKIFKVNYIIKYTILISGVLSIISRIYDVYNIAIADVILGIGSEGIILFRYAMVIGGLLTPVFIKYIKLNNEIKNYFIISEVIVFLFILLPFSNSLTLVIIDLIIFSLMISMQGILFRNILQRHVDNRFIGRIFSMYKILITLISLITVSLVPLIEGMISIKIIFILSGLFTFIIILYYSLKFKKESYIKIKEY